MPNYEDELVEKTFKGQCDTTERRVFYTLSQGIPKQVGTETVRDLYSWLHKTSKLLSLLAAHLEASGQLTEEQLDSMLYEAIS